MGRFGKKNDYQTFVEKKTGREKFVHIRVAEKKLGGAIPKGMVVHLINEDKSDNRPTNLTVITRGVHGRLHGNSPTACFRCGREGHGAAGCYAKTDYAGKRIK